MANIVKFIPNQKLEILPFDGKVKPIPFQFIPFRIIAPSWGSKLLRIYYSLFLTAKILQQVPAS